MIQWFDGSEFKYIDRETAVNLVKDKINQVEDESLLQRILELTCRNRDTLSSNDLAGLIVDALVPGLIDVGEFERAVEIIEEEINARKMLGDY